MGAIRTAINRILIGDVEKPKPRRPFFFRAYQGAAVNRLTNDWKPASVSADQDVFAAMRMLRGRARELCQNNDYARKYLLLARMNVCGPNGFKFQADVRTSSGDADIVANSKIQAAWENWGRAEHCTVTGRMSFRMVQDLAVRHLVRDGEFLARIIRAPEYKYGFALQILEPDTLNENLNVTLENGNEVIMGIEFDPMKRPIAYYFMEASTIPAVFSSARTVRDHVRVPAEEIYHVFDAERALQSRGVSWFAASMYRLKMLTAYEDAALTKARVAAVTGGYFTSESGNEYEGPEQDEAGNQIMPLEPGEWVQLPAGIKPAPVDPNFPSTAHEPFTKGVLRGIASGLGVAYSSLANDLADVNYSSIRAGIVEERDVWRYVQGLVVERFLVPLYGDWLEAALLTENLELPFSNYENYLRPVFTGRRWAWVDPLSDAEAEIKQVAAGFKTRTEIIAERGENIEEIYRELAEEKQLAQKYGLNLEGLLNANGSKNQQTQG